jgi:hypothetical protein
MLISPVVKLSAVYSNSGRGTLDKDLYGSGDHRDRLCREMMERGYKAVTADQRKKWIDKKKDVPIVDTMTLESRYEKQHILAAMQFEFTIPEMKRMDHKKGEFLKLFCPDKDRTLFSSCRFVECSRSLNAAMWAANPGRKNLHRYSCGIIGLSQAEYPIAKGEK